MATTPSDNDDLTPRNRPLGSYYPVFLIALVGVLASSICFGVMRNWEREQTQANTERRAGSLASFLQMTDTQAFTRRNLDATQSIRQMWHLTGDFTDDQFKQFAKFTEQGDLAKVSMEWITRDRGIDGKESFIVRHVEPTAARDLYGGIDLARDTCQVRAFGWATRTGLAAVTGHIPYENTPGAEVTFRMILPAYSPGEPPATPEERDARLRGFSSVLIRIPMEGLTSQFYRATGGLDIVLYEKARGKDSSATLSDPMAGVIPVKPGEITAGFVWDRVLDLAQRRWVLVSHPQEVFLEASRSRRPWIAFGGGLLITICLIIYLIRSVGRASRIETLVAERTAELSRANTQLESQMDERRRAEAALQKYYSSEMLITTISTNFINLAPDEIDGAIGEALRMIGEFDECDRSFIFLFSEDGQRLEFAHEWVAGDTESIRQQYRLLPTAGFDWWMGKLRRSEAIHLPNLGHLPEEAVAERMILSSAPMKSLVAVPMSYGGGLLGFLGFAMLREERSWPEENVRLLRIVGEIFANAMERKRSEEALRGSEEKYRSLLENIADGFYEVDLAGNYLFVNLAMARFLGKPAAELVGENYRETLDESNARHLFTVFHRVFSTGKEENFFTWRLIARDGSERMLEGSVTLVRDRDGAPTGFRGVARDVTERHHAHEEKAKLEERLQQSQKMEAVGRLAGGVAHDFNNLLAGILGYASMLKAEPSAGDRVLKAADVIEKAAERAAQLTRQLLGFARKGKHQNVPVNVHDTVQDVVTLLSRTIDKNIRITQSLKARTPFVLGDPGQIEQVILNLALNARDAMPDGGDLVFETGAVEISHAEAEALQDISAGRYMCMSVSDTGQGIPEEVRARIFEPFFTTKAQGKGTGMGLAMVYGIVNNHGGTIKVKTELGKGTKFTIYFPPGLAPQQIGSAFNGAAPTAPTAGKGRILIVDDEEVVREMASDMLTSMGYEVVTVRDGQEAVDYYQDHADKIDLALIDMVMPRLGGRDCFRALKGINPNVRAVLTTGYGRDGAAQEILNEGMRGFAHKPYGLRDLSEVIAEALR